MGVQIKVPHAVNIRRLHESGLDAEDIIKLGLYRAAEVRRALAAGTKGVSVRK